MKYCPFCKKPIRAEDVIRQPERNEQEQRELEQFCAQVPGGQVPSKPDIKEYHTRVETHGRKRKGVIGGFRKTSVRCGPLREASEAELFIWMNRD